tara:strand:- start:12 stop:602 length:591 start_codon:yes stop_codon:yes gene_type:complete
MFTSRAEYRLLLRQDNADLRLTRLAHEIGLADNQRLEHMINKENETKKIINDLQQKKYTPDQINSWLDKIQQAPIKDKSSVAQLIKRPKLTIKDFETFNSELSSYLSKRNQECIEQAEIQIKYETYIERERKNSEKINNLESQKINPEFNYEEIPALSKEAKEKLLKIKPSTIGQASRISGVSPADVSVLMVYIGR